MRQISRDALNASRGPLPGSIASGRGDVTSEMTPSRITDARGCTLTRAGRRLETENASERFVLSVGRILSAE
jgi:hypothetical protein